MIIFFVKTGEKVGFDSFNVLWKGKETKKWHKKQGGRIQDFMEVNQTFSNLSGASFPLIALITDKRLWETNPEQYSFCKSNSRHWENWTFVPEKPKCLADIRQHCGFKRWENILFNFLRIFSKPHPRFVKYPLLILIVVTVSHLMEGFQPQIFKLRSVASKTFQVLKILKQKSEEIMKDVRISMTEFWFYIFRDFLRSQA